jgi:hypothetical protein
LFKDAKTTFLSIITTRKEHTRVEKFLKTGSTIRFFQFNFFWKKRLPQKAVLLSDNAPSHPNESTMIPDNGLVAVKFLPLPSVTSTIQPTDERVIASMK